MKDQVSQEATLQWAGNQRGQLSITLVMSAVFIPVSFLNGPAGSFTNSLQ
jgi:multidrug efflux pump subunit AcrB